MRLLVVVVVLASCAYGQTGIRIKVVSHTQTTGVPGMLEPQDRTIITYSQGPNRRTETPGFELLRNVPPMKMIVIQRCDDRVLYTLNPDKHEYTETQLTSRENEARARQETQRKWSKCPPNLIIDTKAIDTGETKSAFGHTARHYITTIKEIPAPELSQEATEIVKDAWYLDVPDVTTCEPASLRFGGLIMAQVGGKNAIEEIRPEFRYSGPDLRGLILSEKTTTRSVQVFQTGEKHDIETITSQEIVEMSDQAIDPAIFEVPAGFTRVKQLTQ
jgi:hypothetical protein